MDRKKCICNLFCFFLIARKSPLPASSSEKCQSALSLQFGRRQRDSSRRGAFTRTFSSSHHLSDDASVSWMLICQKKKQTKQKKNLLQRSEDVCHCGGRTKTRPGSTSHAQIPRRHTDWRGHYVSQGMTSSALFTLCCCNNELAGFTQAHAAHRS